MLAEVKREELESLIRLAPPLRADLCDLPANDIWAVLEAVRRTRDRRRHRCALHTWPSTDLLPCVYHDAASTTPPKAP